MKKRIVILGAGPSGLSCAYWLLKRNRDIEVTVLEKEADTGGIAASFTEDGLTFDYGSHRLHPSTDPLVLREIRDLIGEDLLDRPRNGRILLLNRFVKFPLKPLNFFFRLPFTFFLGIFADILLKPFRDKSKPERTFKDALERGLGRTICRHFYFPYAEKLWGLPPDRLSLEQAKRRVAANSIAKIVRKVLSVMPFLKSKGAGRFYYPRQGFGRIFRAFGERIREMGGGFFPSQNIEEVFAEGNRITGVKANGIRRDADIVFSTIPVDRLTSLLNGHIPQNVAAANAGLAYRRMVFCYLILKTGRFTPYDAHYFPDSSLLFSRLSEPRNYSCAELPEGRTGLCLEIPCSQSDGIWNATDKEIVGRCIEDLARAGLPAGDLLERGFTRRLPNIYPVYDLESTANQATATGYIDSLAGLVTFGRQGLFIHDNTHHAIAMGMTAAGCVTADGAFLKEKWAACKEEFKNNIVED